MWVADPNSPPSGRAVQGGGAPDHRRPSQRWKAPPRERPSATPTASNAGPQGCALWGRCWVPRPHRPHPEHTGRGTPAARPRGRAAGGGTAPDTRRASQRWQATPPGDGPPPTPWHAASTGHAGQGDSVGLPHPHNRAHSTWVADPNSPPSGRAVGGGGAPDHKRSSQRWKAPPPGTPFRQPHSEQRRPAWVHAVGRVLGPPARTDRTRNTRVAEPRLPTPADGRPGEGQRLTPDAPHTAGRPAPPGTVPHHPRGTQPPRGIQAKGTVLGPHTHTPAPTACGWRTPTARPVRGQFRQGERLTTDAPHNGGRHPSGNALPPPPQRATPARKGARCGAGAGSPRPHRPHPGHTVRGTPAARPRGQAAGGGTAPDTKRPSQRWQAGPPGDGPPPPPRHAAPTGHAGQGDSVGPPHPHTRAHSTWVADHNIPPSGRAVGGGGAPDLRPPSQRWKAPPPGRPFRHPHSEQHRPARAHAVGPVLGPHARTDRTRDTRVAEPRLPAPEDGRPGGGQRVTPDAPHNGGRPPPPGTALPPPPRHAAPTGHAGQGDSVGPQHPDTRAHSTWVADLNSPPSGRAVGGGGAPDLRRPSQRWKAPPPGTPFRHPQSEQRRPARAHAVEPVLGPHAHTDRTRNTRVAVPRLPAPEDGRSGEGQRLTPDATHNRGRPAPPGDGPPPPPRQAAPQGACMPSQVGGNRDRTAAPQAHQTEQGTAAGHAEGHGPRATALPAPSAGTARGVHATPPRGGGSGRRGSASAHTHKGHAGTTRRATGHSLRNAKTAWNGVPASEGKGHLDGTARHKQRGTRGAGRGTRERPNTRYRPKPPEPATSAAHTRTGHCTCQGSSGALRHAPAPRLGSHRASPRGSNWRQASSTGPAAPAPRATTH